MEAGKTGVSNITPEQILFGAGTIHKGLKYTKGTDEASGKFNFAESCKGATSGGSKLSIVPEVYVPELDGVFVPTKGLKKKVGGKAVMEVNFAEVDQDTLKSSTYAVEGNSEDANYILLEDSSDIPDDAYWDNVAFVGVTLEGKPIIAILDNALITNGFDNDFKNKEQLVGKFTFECHADLATATTFDKLPWHIYWPKKAAQTAQ